MKCEDVQDLINEYAEERLPESTRVRIDQHLATCKSCKADYQFWADSNDWISAEREHYAAVASTRSIVDAVMARILSEEKWAIPFGRKVFTLTAGMRRMTASAAAVLLLLCGFTLYSQTSTADSAMLPENGVVAMVNKVDVVSAGEEEPKPALEIKPTPAEQDWEMATDQILPVDQQDQGDKPNFGLMLGFFGILITVISMSWVTRVKDRK